MLAVASSGSGCSLIFAQPARDSRFHIINEDCTTGNGLPAADGFLALASILGAAMAGVSASSGTRSSDGQGFKMVVLGGSGMLFAGSAVYGLSLSAECRRTVEQEAPVPRRWRPRPSELRAPPPPAVTPPPGESPQADAGSGAPPTAADGGTTPEPPAAPPPRPRIQQQSDQE